MSNARVDSGFESVPFNLLTCRGGAEQNPLKHLCLDNRGDTYWWSCLASEWCIGILCWSPSNWRGALSLQLSPRPQTWLRLWGFHNQAIPLFLEKKKDLFFTINKIVKQAKYDRHSYTFMQIIPFCLAVNASTVKCHHGPAANNPSIQQILLDCNPSTRALRHTLHNNHCGF